VAMIPALTLVRRPAGAVDDGAPGARPTSAPALID